MNTRRKGNRLEKERQDAFERAGALVLRAAQAYRYAGPEKFFVYSADFFGVADLLVFRAGTAPLLVSVSTLNGVAARRRRMGERVDEFLGYGIECEVHAKGDRKPWRVWSPLLKESRFTEWKEIHDSLPPLPSGSPSPLRAHPIESSCGSRKAAAGSGAPRAVEPSGAPT